MSVEIERKETCPVEEPIKAIRLMYRDNTVIAHLEIYQDGKLYMTSSQSGCLTVVPIADLRFFIHALIELHTQLTGEKICLP